MSAYPLETRDEQILRELEKYNIRVVPISLSRTYSHQYVFINPDTIIMTKEYIQSGELVEISLSTNEQILIVKPVKINSLPVGIRDLIYDKTTNSVHVLYNSRNPKISFYFILRLDNYTWEEIKELENEISECWYDPENSYVYIDPFVHQYPKSIIRIFDLKKREFLEDLELPDGTGTVANIYVKQQKMMVHVLTNNGKYPTYLAIYDMVTGTMKEFPESNNEVIFSFDSRECIPVKEDGCFLGIRWTGGKDEIALMDLNYNTLKSVVLQGFPFHIYNLQEYANGVYSFIVRTRNSLGFYDRQFLCFLDIKLED
jgi:hypothetical protein